MIYLRSSLTSLGAVGNHPCQSGGACRCNGSCRGMGQFLAAQAPRQLDPILSTALAAAEATLGTTDSGASESFGYIRRILGARSTAPAGKKDEPGRLSDLNKYLKAGSWAVERPLTVAALAVAIPAIAFALGRASKRRK